MNGIAEESDAEESANSSSNGSVRSLTQNMAGLIVEESKA